MTPSSQNRAYVHGAAVHMSWRQPSMSLTDMIFGCVSEAVKDSAVPMEHIHSVVLSAHDIVDGRSLSSMVTAPAAGAYLRDEIRLAEDGLAALSLGAARIEAGETEYSIVAAWGRASEGDYERTSRTGFDPFQVQPFGLNEFDLSSLRLSAWMARHGAGTEARARAVAARLERAERNTRSVRGTVRARANAPLRAEEAPCFADIAVAVILGRPKAAVRVAGVGHSADSPAIGDRNLLVMPALRDAVSGACNTANISLESIDFHELAGATLTDEALALEALGLAEAGKGFDAYASRNDINPSGGGERGWCFPTGGLLNAVEAILQLKGKAGGVQLGGTPRTALVTGLSPIGGQAAHAAVLELV